MSQRRPLYARAYSFSNSLPVRLGFFLLAALLANGAILLQAGGMNTFHDAQFLSAYERHAVLTVTQYGQLPLWDPFNCGGLYGLAAPQTRYASPFFLLSLLFGVDRGSALLAVVMPALGMEGMYRYARSWGALSLPAFLFAPLMPLSGFFAFAWHYGWIQFFSFCLVPWILFGLRRALRGDTKGALTCALSVAITVGFGGTYTLPMAAILVLAELLDALAPRLLQLRGGLRSYGERLARRARTTTLGLAVATPLVLGIGAYRLWPMLESVSATLRVMGGEPRLPFEALSDLLTVLATKSAGTTGHFYLAPVALLALLALPWRTSAALWLGAGLSFALAYGHASPHAPFTLLRKLPIYDTLRYPERYLLLFAIPAAILATKGATTLLGAARRFLGRRGQLAMAGLLTAAAVAGIMLESKNTRALVANVELMPTPVAHPAPFRQSRGNRWLMSHFAAEGMGSLGCGEAYPLPMSTRLRGDLQSEEYLTALDDGRSPIAGTAKRLSWSPNRVVVAVDSPTPVRLAINQNYHPGWHSSVGQVESWDGLLSVRLPAGRQRVEVSFLPRSALGGLLASLVALVAGGVFVLRAPRSLAARAGLLLAGPLAVLLLRLAWPEPPWRSLEPLTESGEPVILDEVPAHATPLKTSFFIPLTLEAALVPQAPLPLGATELPLELFFRRTGPLSSSLGFFLHLRGPNGELKSADHPELSGRVYIARMPEGKVVRDALRVALPENARGEWEVRVGLWMAYGDGQRAFVRDKGLAAVENNEVTVGRFRFASP